MTAPRRDRPLLPVLAALALLWLCGGPRSPVALGTFNIRMFPEDKTDTAGVVAAIAELNADAFAVQEIRGALAFQEVVRAAAARTGRDYRVALETYCKPRAEGPMYLGVVYDASRLELRARRSLEPWSGCDADQPHGMVASLAGDGREFALASIHFKAGSTKRDIEIRRQQWAWLTAQLAGLREELGLPVVLAGDFNSTGYREGGEERGFIDDAVRVGKLEVATEELGCSMYWPPVKSGPYVTNVLDHVLVSEGLEVETAEALGMCARLRCTPQEQAPIEWQTVSDHCPVRVSLR